MNSWRRIKVGVIGCGSVSGKYFPHFASSPFVELVSVCDIVPERVKERAEQFQVTNHYSHIDKLLAGAALDLLVNLTDVQEHGRLNLLAIEAGKHIWSEKLIANSLEAEYGLLAMAMAKKKGVRVWGHQPRCKARSSRLWPGRSPRKSSDT